MIKSVRRVSSLKYSSIGISIKRERKKTIVRFFCASPHYALIIRGINVNRPLVVEEEYIIFFVFVRTS